LQICDASYKYTDPDSDSDDDLYDWKAVWYRAMNEGKEKHMHWHKIQHF
jgi:hypothetical protein